MQQQHFLETQRTYLRQLCQADFTELAAILGDLEVMYAWEHAFTDEEIHAWLEENFRRYTRDGHSYWAVILKETGKLVGVAGVFQEEAAKQEYFGLGYIFDKAFWHQGLAFECAQACKDYAFKVLHSPLLTAQIRPENTASKKLAEKLGMSLLRQFEREYRGKSVPHLLYGCLK